MNRYEYKVIDVTNTQSGNLTKLLNEYGEQGWRVVTSLVGDLNILQFLLERPLVEAGRLSYHEEQESRATVGDYHRLDDNEEYED